MARWIEDGKITDGDFAYFCGSLVSGLWVGYSKREYRISMTTADNSYGLCVGNAIKRLTNLNPTVRDYTYKTKVGSYTYNKPRTFLQLEVPIRKIDFWAKSKTLKENFRKLNEILLNSEKEMQRMFLQAVMDAKASPKSDKYGLDICLYANIRQLPVISSVLKAYGIRYGLSPKINPKFIYIRNQEDVDKVVNEIGFNSERVKRMIKI